MRRNLILVFVLFLFASTVNAQNDTMYVMKKGNILGKFKVSDVDSIIFFQPQIYPTFTDSRDSNVYQTVTIGNQIWMAENLKYLPIVGPDSSKQSTFVVYNYKGTNVAEAKATFNYNTYGVLYTWETAMNGAPSSSANPSGVQGVCPSGWHLPSDAEWTQLTNYLGGESVAGGKLKEIEFTHWISPNSNATNEKGFTALPGGEWVTIGDRSLSMMMGRGGYWWSATDKSTLDAWLWFIYYNRRDLSGVPNSMKDGFSVRCVKD